MATFARPRTSRRLAALTLSAAIHLAALAALLLWHFAPAASDREAPMTVVDLADPPLEKPKPPPPEPMRTHDRASSGAPAPAGPKAEAAPLAAAIPVVIPTLPASIVPATGAAASSGAALSGSGTGAGGAGNGTGGGGDGNGAGGRTRLAAEPQAIRGYFNKNDYPKALREAKPKGTTGAEVMVGVDGRPLSCRVTDPSGIPLFDSETCRLLLKRFRFRPARDMSGKPVAAPWAMDVDWDYIDLNEE